MRTRKAAIFVSFISGISLVFTGITGSSIYAAEEISEQSEIETEGTYTQSEEETKDYDIESEMNESRTERESKIDETAEEEMLETGEENPESSDRSDSEKTENQESDDIDVIETDKENENDSDTNSNEENTEQMDTDGIDESKTENEAQEIQQSEELLERIDVEKESANIVLLQIPQKLEVTLDPWNLNHRGQVYSEEYTIRNAGKEAGILMLSFCCQADEYSGAVIYTEKEYLHDEEGEKAIYLELKIGDTESIVLTDEDTVYQKELQPNEELIVSFAGEVNENAKWRNGDITIKGEYTWEALGATIQSEETENIETESDSGETCMSETETEISGEYTEELVSEMETEDEDVTKIS